MLDYIGFDFSLPSTIVDRQDEQYRMRGEGLSDRGKLGPNWQTASLEGKNIATILPRELMSRKLETNEISKEIQLEAFRAS